MSPTLDFDALSPGSFTPPAVIPDAPADYQRIFETISEGLIIHDAASLVVVEANPAAAAMHGYTREAFIGLHPTSFIHPDSHERLSDYSQAVHSGGQFETLAVHISRDGEPFYAEVRGTAFDYQGRPCLLTVIRNVNARVQAEQQLQQQAQTFATLQERQRLAQNLHDAVNQSLFSAGLIAEVLPRLWERNPAEGRRSLADLRRLTSGALAEMRGLLAELRPQVLIDSELTDLLHQLGSSFTGRTNIPVAVTVVGQGTLPADVQVAFYRLCQEVFNNIAKHARASQVTLRLAYADDGTIELHIRDDGRGFDPEHTPSGHYGLSMMRERAEATSVILLVTSQPGQGTEIAIRWQAGLEQKAQ
jgi:PAS domain S-box-containing protein